MNKLNKAIILIIALVLSVITEQYTQTRMSGLGAGFIGAGVGMAAGYGLGKRSARRKSYRDYPAPAYNNSGYYAPEAEVVEVYE